MEDTGGADTGAEAIEETPTTEEGHDATNLETVPAVAEGVEAPEAPAEEAKTFTFKGLKSDGEDFDLTDAPEEEVRRLLQLGKTAHSRFNQVVQERKNLDRMHQEIQQQRGERDTFKALFESDPMAAAQQLGIEPQKLMDHFEQKLLNQFRREQAPEHERAVLEAEERADAAQKRAEEYEAKEKQREDHIKLTRNQETIQGAIIKGLEEGDLPGNEFMVKRMAAALGAGIQRGHGLNIKNAIAITKEGLQGDMQSLVGGHVNEILNETDPVKLAQGLKNLIGSLGGERVIYAIRKADISGLRNKAPRVPAGSLQQPPATTKRSEEETNTTYEFDNYEDVADSWRERALAADKRNRR